MTENGVMFLHFFFYQLPMFAKLIIHVYNRMNHSRIFSLFYLLTEQLLLHNDYCTEIHGWLTNGFH